MRMRTNEKGFALITTLMLLAVLATFLAAYIDVTRLETASTRHTKDRCRWFL